MTSTAAPMCATCKHFIAPFRCAAFPKRIPNAILDGEYDHRKPYPGDNGIRYEPIEDDDAS